MNKLMWRIIIHGDLSESDECEIAKLKDQHWQHGIDSQIVWMRNNYLKDDYHLLGFEETLEGRILRAYLSFTNVNVIIDDNSCKMYGIGCVCVDKTVEHTGYGRILLNYANSFIERSNYKGILLCKEKLVRFYEKCGWHLLDYKKSEVAGSAFTEKIMLLNETKSCSAISIDRNF